MNERIQKLAVQAHVYADGHSLLCHEGDIKKFAELIVAECKTINSTLLGHNTCKDLHTLYNKHFGVEE